ncbi:hypothetical protein JQ594_04130 [Bradyrhizobium manausense]|uniref:hypothetical protein n=1 Tax=Bradyrhizobium manausense TaxID=989370 RepID=UPI001BAD4AF2|nr:hypothetical protein [Bradyrhizobium manausense]MBR0685090.1 hypothetical protein [Bradyrhizobium manausense]MBR0726459.1 hypothetical protein [Bradyrhizobium manausense]
MTIAKTLGFAAIAIAATGVSSASFAGPGPCTSSKGMAVGIEGPAMNGGQRMAGVGNCRHGRWRNSYGYYRGPVDSSYGYDDRGYGYPHEQPGVSIDVGPGRW